MSEAFKGASELLELIEKKGTVIKHKKHYPDKDMVSIAVDKDSDHFGGIIGALYEYPLAFGYENLKDKKGELERYDIYKEPEDMNLYFEYYAYSTGLSKEAFNFALNKVKNDNADKDDLARLKTALHIKIAGLIKDDKDIPFETLERLTMISADTIEQHFDGLYGE